MPISNDSRPITLRKRKKLRNKKHRKVKQYNRMDQKMVSSKLLLRALKEIFGSLSLVRTQIVGKELQCLKILMISRTSYKSQQQTKRGLASFRNISITHY